MMSLGEKIATLRKQKNLTQEALAEKCSVSAQAVSKWENDLTAPDIALIPRLASLFGVTCDELLGATRAEVTAVNPATVDLNKMLLKVRINSHEGDKVNINLPLAIAELLIKNKKFVETLEKSGDGEKNAFAALHGVDFVQVVTLVREGAIGKLVEIEDKEGTKVEIFVE